MNAVETILAVVRNVRARGVEVEFESGWERRGNGMTAAYRGLIVHHTSAPSSAARPCPAAVVLRDGRSDLRGPLCNFQGCSNGVIRVIAAHPANHAGASGGRSIGPLPVTNLFNRFVMGLEIDYTGSVPMTTAAYRSSQLLGAAVVEVLGVSPEHVRAHAETSVTGKWDPGFAPGKTINMAAFRQGVAALLEGDGMNPNDLLDAPLTREGLPAEHPLAANPTFTLRAWLQWADAERERDRLARAEDRLVIDKLLDEVTTLTGQARDVDTILRELRERPTAQVTVDTGMLEEAFVRVVDRTRLVVRD